MPIRSSKPNRRRPARRDDAAHGWPGRAAGAAVGPGARADPGDRGDRPDEQNLAYSLGAIDHLQEPVEWGQPKEAREHFRPAVHEGPVQVVDDDLDMRKSMTNPRTREGWRFAAAERGRAALEAVGVRKAGLIPLDLMTLEMDGYACLRALRARLGSRDIPVVVPTAKDVTADDCRRLAGRADRIVQKGASAWRISPPPCARS